jgi:hypothetical protein
MEYVNNEICLKTKLDHLNNLHVKLFYESKRSGLRLKSVDIDLLKNELSTLCELSSNLVFQNFYESNENFKAYIIKILEALLNLIDNTEYTLLFSLFSTINNLFNLDINLKEAKFKHGHVREFYTKLSFQLTIVLNQNWENLIIGLSNSDFRDEDFIRIVSYSLYCIDFDEKNEFLPFISNRISCFDVKCNLIILVSATIYLANALKNENNNLFNFVFILIDTNGLKIGQKLFASSLQVLKQELNLDDDLIYNSFEERVKYFHEIIFYFIKRFDILINILSACVTNCLPFTYNNTLLESVLKEIEELGDLIHEYVNFLSDETIDRFIKMFLSFHKVFKTINSERYGYERKNIQQRMHEICFWLFNHLETDAKFYSKIDIVLLDSTCMHILEIKSLSKRIESWNSCKTFITLFILDSNIEIYKTITSFCMKTTHYNEIRDSACLIFESLSKLITQNEQINSIEYLNEPFIECVSQIAKCFNKIIMNESHSRDINNFLFPLMDIVYTLFSKLNSSTSLLIKMNKFYLCIFKLGNLHSIRKKFYFKLVDLVLVKLHNFIIKTEFTLLKGDEKHQKFCDTTKEILNYLNYILTNFVSFNKFNIDSSILNDYIATIEDILAKIDMYFIN